MNELQQYNEIMDRIEASHKKQNIKNTPNEVFLEALDIFFDTDLGQEFIYKYEIYARE